MVDESGTVVESLPTLAALVGLLPRVDPVVFDEVGHPAEGLATLAT